MTSIRQTKKYNAKILVWLWKDHTPRDVKHYSRGIRRYRKEQRQNPWLVWQREVKRVGDRMLRMPSFRQLGINVEDIERWSREMMGELCRAHVIPGVIPPREKSAESVAEYWHRPDDKPHAMCLGSRLLYAEPTLSSLADSRCLKSYLHNPIQLSSSDAKAIHEQLYWQLKHLKQ